MRQRKNRRMFFDVHLKLKSVIPFFDIFLLDVAYLMLYVEMCENPMCVPTSEIIVLGTDYTAALTRVQKGECMRILCVYRLQK